MPGITHVELTQKVKKQLQKLPKYIVENLIMWVESIENDGLEEVRRIPGYHDEPLLGQRKGQRSIRLSRAYRAIYEVKKDRIEFIEVQEVHKHDY